MEIANILQTGLIQDSQELSKSQNSFLQSTLGKIINTGLNIGIRAILPNVIEDQVIEIKDAILNNGFKDGIKQAIKSAIDLGKSALGIVTGKFENISQAQTAIKTGGLIDTLSEGLNSAINQANKNGLIDDTQSMLLRKGNNAILSTIESNIEENFFSQQKSLEFLGKYENNWKDYYKHQDFVGMEREYNKIKNILKTLLPIEETLNQAKQIENLHLLIKNNGQNFNLSGEELELAKRLIS